MIEFEIDESYGFRGGNPYCSFYARSPKDVIEALKDAWHGSGIHSHEGELFLTACLHDDEGEEVQLFFRHCAVVRDKVKFNFEILDGIVDPWHYFGLFIVDETDNVLKILDKMFDYDCPDRVIGSYLFKAHKKYDELSAIEQENFSAILLANILEFGKNEGKLLELSSWIFSKQGLKFLDKLERTIDIDFHSIAQLRKSINEAELLQFIEKFKKDIGVKIYLPSRY